MTIGKLIVFEGIDGCGKDTQLDLLADRMEEKEILFMRDRQPSDGEIGKLIRREYLSKKSKTDDTTLRLLFAADCYDHITRRGGLLDILKVTNVLCSRFYHSNIAYGNKDRDFYKLLALSDFSSKLLKPDITIILDIPVDMAMHRVTARGTKMELFETEERLKRAKESYIRMISKMNERFLLVDGTKPKHEIGNYIWSYVSKILGVEE